MKEAPGLYLERHLEKDDVYEEIPESLAEPLTQTNPFEGTDPVKFEVENRGLKMEITASGAASREVMRQLNSFDIEEYDEGYEQWRILESFVLSDQEGNKLDLHELFTNTPSDEDGPWSSLDKSSDDGRRVSVLFNTTNEKPSKDAYKNGPTAAAMTGQQAIVLTQNICSPSTIIAMLHEIGHIMNPPSENFMNRKRYAATLDRNYLSKADREDPDIDAKIADDIIRRERDANAWAINQLRPFVRSGAINQEDLIKHVHQTSLKSNYDYVDKFLNPTLKARVIGKLKSLYNYNIRF